MPNMSCDTCKHRTLFEGGWVSNKKGVPLGIQIIEGCKGKELSIARLKKIKKDGCKSYSPQRRKQQ